MFFVRLIVFWLDDSGNGVWWIENPELPKVKETAHGEGDIVKSGEKDRPRSSKHRSDDKDDGDGHVN